MIKIWTASQPAGLLDRPPLSEDPRQEGSIFRYFADTRRESAISLTMPTRLESYNTRYGLAPFFEMNLPEGRLREALRLRFARQVGRFDDLDLLALTGRSQLGRVRYTGNDDSLQHDVPFQKVDEILAMRRGGNLFHELVAQFDRYSGISGAQPKLLIRDAAASVTLSGGGGRASETFKSATHIVKFWEQTEFPQLAANEFFCMTAAKAAGLEVPPFQLSEDAMALVVERFDILPDGSFLGMEDFCVLNARRTGDKYRGSYETAIMKRFADFARTGPLLEDLERLFALIALNCALRNGDAHLKNFAVTYREVEGEVRLAPVYDLVTTSVYPGLEGGLALTLNGSTRWPDAKALQKLGETRAHLTPSSVKAILQRLEHGMEQAAGELRAYVASHAEFADIGRQMLGEWEAGIQHSLGGTSRQALK